MHVQPYLFFDGRCEEAMEFYRRTLGAEVTFLMRFKENPEPGANPPGSEEKVMHAAFRIGDSEILASDGQCAGSPSFQGFSLTVHARDAGEAERLFAALVEGGQARMPMGKTFFAERFGMLSDRFGVGWMVIAGTPQ